MPDYELLLTMLSALKWRQLNGPLTLFCDVPGLLLYERAGLASLWDAVDTTLVPRLAKHPINPAIFWSAAKMLVLEHLPAPCVSLDADLIAWENLDGRFHGHDLVVTHWESTRPSPWYPPLDQLSVPAGYQPQPDWDWSAPAANTSLIFFRSEEFKQMYVREYYRFCRGNQPDATRSELGNPYVLFSDQRLLALCAKQWGARVGALIEGVWVSSDTRFERTGSVPPWDFPRIAADNFLTHAWIHKTVLKRHPTVRRGYCLQLVEELLRSFPETASVLREAEPFRPFYLQVTQGEPLPTRP